MHLLQKRNQQDSSVRLSFLHFVKTKDDFSLSRISLMVGRIDSPIYLFIFILLPPLI